MPLPTSRPASSDPYAVLGVKPGASPAEIKAAYRALVKRHHPDAGGDVDRILALNAAWEVLRERVRPQPAGADATPPGAGAAPATRPACADHSTSLPVA